MTVVIGYVPNQYGEAALQVGLQEAEARQLRVVVVNASRGDAYVDKRFVNEQALSDLDERLTAAGVDHRVHQAVGVDVGDEIVRVAEAEPRRARRHRHPAPLARRQGADGVGGPDRDHGRAVPGADGAPRRPLTIHRVVEHVSRRVENGTVGSDVPGMNTTARSPRLDRGAGPPDGRAQVDGLDDAQLRATPLPSGWSMLGLLGHVRDSTHFWLHHVLLGHPTELDEDEAWDDDPALPAAEVVAGFVASYVADVAAARGLAADSAPALVAGRCVGRVPPGHRARRAACTSSPTTPPTPGS